MNNIDDVLRDVYVRVKYLRDSLESVGMVCLSDQSVGDWSQRKQICVNVSKALECLHGAQENVGVLLRGDDYVN
jgi:hypothetical protein